jgi:flagellar protein FliS
MDNRFQAYKQNEVSTAGRGKIVVMLFSGAITFLNKAKLAMEKKDYETKGNYILKAMNIIEELNISLDMENGKDIAQNLKSIYLFLDRYINEASIENNPDKIDKAIGIIDKLKTAFDEILKNPAVLESQEFSQMEQAQSTIKRIV